MGMRLLVRKRGICDMGEGDGRMYDGVWLRGSVILRPEYDDVGVKSSICVSMMYTDRKKSF